MLPKSCFISSPVFFKHRSYIVIYIVALFVMCYFMNLSVCGVFAVPGDPRKVKVEVINSTCMFVEWEEPKDTNGRIRGYLVYYIKVNSNDEPLSGSPEQYHDTFNGDLHEAVITGLEADTRYLIQVSAYTRKGDGVRSKTRIITTKGAGIYISVYTCVCCTCMLPVAL